VSRVAVWLAACKVPFGLLVWVLMLYANSLDNSFHYDDTHSLIENVHVRSLANVGRFFVDPGAFSAMPEARMYRPLLLVSYAVNHAIDGYEPFGYHLFNVLLHAINACLVWLIAQRVLGRHSMALTAALLFATHPVVAEPINYISSRSTLLAALFVLAAMLVLIDGSRRPGWRHHLALTALAIAALWSKSVGIVLLPAAALWLWLLGVGGVRSWLLLAGPAVAAIAYILGTKAIIGKALLEPVRTPAVQAATQLKAISFYVYTNLFPAHLSIEPQFSAASPLFSLVPVLSLVLAICLVVVVVRLRRLNPPAAFGAAWFAVTLVPSSVVPLNVLVNEHRLYLPLVGGTLLAGALLGAAGRRRRMFAPVLLLVWTVLVWQRNRDWSSEETIWLDAAHKGPAMPRVHVNLGKGYLESGRYEEAIAASRRGLALDPNIALAHYNIGTAYLNQDRFEESIASFEAALELQPAMMEALNNLGNAYQHQQRYERSIETFQRALADNDWSQLHHNLGAAFLAAGQADSAAVHFQKAHEADPGDRESMMGLARSLIQAQRLQQAQLLLHRSLGRTPDDTAVRQLLALSQVGLGQDDEALASYQRAGLSVAEAHLRIGELARQRHDWRRARDHFEMGLVVAPENANLLDGLGTVSIAEGDWNEALELFRRAAREDGGLASAFRNIGLVNLHHRRPSEALAALNRARDLDSADGKVWELLARAQGMSGRPSEAMAAYRRAIELLPERAMLYRSLGQLHEDNGQLSEAEKLYREAIQRDPENIQSLNSLGHLLLTLERWSEGARTLERLLQKEPASTDVYINLASAYINLGETNRAATAYEQFLQLYGTEDDMRRKVQRQLQLLREDTD
jgi:protein O-mannosyl-transferase